MKKIFIIGTFMLMCQQSFAQEKVTTKEFDKNHIKLNLFALPLRSFSLQCERGLNENISIAMGLRLQPKGSIPFKSSIKSAFDADTIDINFIDNVKMSSWAITPEFRYYFGKRPLNGFYIAPFIRIQGFNMDWQHTFTEDDGTKRQIDFTGKATGFSGGLLLGAQWHVGKRFLIDWWLLGPCYGSFKVNLNAQTDLSDLVPDDKAELKAEIEDMGVQGSKFTATVNNTGVKADGRVPLPGIRTGLCIGYTF